MFQGFRRTTKLNANKFNILAFLSLILFAHSSYATNETFLCSGETVLGHIEVYDVTGSKTKNYYNDFINLQIAVGSKVIRLNKKEVALLDNGKYGRIFLGSSEKFSVSFSINQKKTAAELSLKFDNQEILSAATLTCESTD